MNNPRLRDLASSFGGGGGGGGMPDIGALMSDPSLREMCVLPFFSSPSLLIPRRAMNMMGGGGAGRGAGRGAGS